VAKIAELVLFSRIRAISPYFDKTFYLEQVLKKRESAACSPLLHYLTTGWMRGLAPNRQFDPERYRILNPQMHWAAEPLFHFVQLGEKRAPSDSTPLKPNEPTSIYSSNPSGGAVDDRFVIYTAIVGAYDTLKYPAFIPPNCDLVVFSDQLVVDSRWKVLPLNYHCNDPVRAARFVKLHPHLYFSSYEYSIWIDGNIIINDDLSPLLSRLQKNDFISTFVHPLRNCVYQEGTECIKRQKDDEFVIWDQLRRYRREGIPEHIGLWETNVLVRRHNDDRCVQLMTNWWREIEKGSRRDQLSLPIVVRRLGAEIVPLDNPGVCARTHPFLAVEAHVKRSLNRSPPTTSPNIDVTQKSAYPISLGICVHNALEDVKRCIEGLNESWDFVDQIIIVDDGSDSLTREYLERAAKRSPKFVLIQHCKSVGYTKSANEILRLAKSDWILLLNSDAVMPSVALHRLMEAASKYPRLAILGPMSNAAGWQSAPTLLDWRGSFRINLVQPELDLVSMNELCAKVADQAIYFTPLVNGFCIAIRRKVLNQIGFFDEDEFPFGYGEEDDLCIRCVNAGFICGIVPSAYVYHRKTGSFSPSRRAALMKTGQKALSRLHGSRVIEIASDTMRLHPGLKAFRERLATAIDEEARARKACRSSKRTERLN
jgi:GT2 family glycosyltransferase